MKFRCKVITRSSRNEVVGIDNLYRLDLGFKGRAKDDELPMLRIYLTAVPENGKANKKLVEVLSEAMDISRSRISIIKGEKSHEKVIEIDD
ncbi:MAG: DUF167 domain-containing protein [Candidatus Paceibacterota bacterium]|jgi:hypothetical protein